LLVLEQFPKQRTGPAAQVENALDDLDMLRQFDLVASRKLTLAAYYSSSATWSEVGYPGPPTIVLPT
jgi:hypothetical protein